MKIGIRKPSLKKSLKAKTTGRAKRAMKSAVNPLYGKKGMGMINNPKKAMYNKVYNKTTVSAKDVLSGGSSANRTEANSTYPNVEYNRGQVKKLGKNVAIGLLVMILSFIFVPFLWFVSIVAYVLYVIIMCVACYVNITEGL